MKYYFTKDEMLKAINMDVIILDTRSENEFTGERQKNGAKKGGRIPRSILIDWANAIDYHGDKKLKPKEDLEIIYKNFLPSKDDDVIVYCHSGVRSAHTTFILTQLLGYKNVKNYDGSWVEWSHFSDYLVEQDSVTKIFE